MAITLCTVLPMGFKKNCPNFAAALFTDKANYSRYGSMNFHNNHK